MRIREPCDPANADVLLEDGSAFVFHEVPDLPQPLRDRMVIDCARCRDDKYNGWLQANGTYWCRCLTTNKFFDQKHIRKPTCHH